MFLLQAFMATNLSDANAKQGKGSLCFLTAPVLDHGEMILGLANIYKNSHA